jgi:hypothetical protein
LKKKHAKLFEENVSEILNVVHDSSSSDIRKKALELTTDLATKRNIKDILAFLNKEITLSK